MDDRELEEEIKKREEQLNEEYETNPQINPPEQDPLAPKQSLFINPLKGYNENRQQAIDTGAQFVDKVVTGGLEKINMPGAQFIGDRARNISGFTADMLIPEDWEIPIMGAAIAVDGPLPIGDALAGLKYGQGVGSRIYRAGVKAAKTGQLDTVAKNANAIIEYSFSRANSLFNKGQPGWRVATPNNIDVNPNVMQSKGVPPAIDIPDYAFPSLDNAGPKTLFQRGKSRQIKSQGITGIPVTGNVKAAFKRAGIEQIEELQTKLGIPLDEVKWQIHHKGLIRQVYDSLNGLTEEYRLKGADLLSRKLGYKLGYDPTNASAIPEILHPRIHAIINNQLSGTPNTFDLKGLERRLNLPANWQSTYTYKQREGIINEIANVINDSTDQIDVFYRGLQGRTNLLGKLSADEYTASVLDIIALDKRLANLPTPGVMSHQGAHKYQTASEIINDILIQAGKVNLSLPAFNKLDINDLQVIAKAQIIDQKLLSEALISNQQAKTVYNAYKDIIGVSWTEFNDILKQIDPNKLYQKGFSIEDIDQHLRTGWGDPTKGTSSLKSSYSAQDLRNKGWSITDIENAIQAGWEIILD